MAILFSWEEVFENILLVYSRNPALVRYLQMVSKRS
jgi:hypothetical protein